MFLKFGLDVYGWINEENGPGRANGGYLAQVLTKLLFDVIMAIPLDKKKSSDFIPCMIGIILS